MNELAAILKRAASFLEALPADVPEPEVSIANRGEWLDFRWFDEPSMGWAKVSLSGETVTLRELGQLPVSVHFDGATVPPAIVAAIRRVTSG